MNNKKITVQYGGMVLPSAGLNVDALLKQAFGFYQQRRLQEAHALCVKVLTANPRHFGALQLMGGIALDTMNYDHAVHFFTLCLQVNPKDSHSFRNRGMVFERQRKIEAAIADYNKAVEINPNFTDTYYSLGNLYALLNNHEKSVLNYDLAIKLNSNANYIYGSRLMEAMKDCVWDNYQDQLDNISTKIGNGVKASPPFAISTLGRDAKVQRDAAVIWSESEYPANGSLGPFPPRSEGGKIRVGYFSADFRNHPVAYLTAELFEQHDRAAFEIIAFSYAGKVDDEMQNRLRQSFDAFHDVSGMGDMQIADFARKQGIGIAVDLGGHTVNNKFGVFAYRAAPIQVGYLGYLGTTGANYMDYIVADHMIIPPECRENYTEKIIYLPCYQVNDSKSKAVNVALSRADYKLPADKFVYCCFNSVYKINPAVFDSWMRILVRAENSVLFLAPDSDRAHNNLKQEAERRGVDPDRIISSQPLPRPAFLARFKTADLFLDTWPCNAGTTAGESLWSGLPVLTFPGQTFASRIAASLLAATGLPELIANSQEQYEEMAVDLSRNPAKLRKMSNKLLHQNATSPLFDVRRFAGHLETAFKHITEQSRSGALPGHVFVEA